jgi:hypothetical protein
MALHSAALAATASPFLVLQPKTGAKPRIESVLSALPGAHEAAEAPCTPVQAAGCAARTTVDREPVRPSPEDV